MSTPVRLSGPRTSREVLNSRYVRSSAPRIKIRLQQGTHVMTEQRYEVRVTATGTVRDADGNIVSEQPIEATAVLTENEVRALTQGEKS